MFKEWTSTYVAWRTKESQLITEFWSAGIVGLLPFQDCGKQGMRWLKLCRVRFYQWHSSIDYSTASSSKFWVLNSLGRINFMSVQGNPMSQAGVHDNVLWGFHTCTVSPNQFSNQFQKPICLWHHWKDFMLSCAVLPSSHHPNCRFEIIQGTGSYCTQFWRAVFCSA